MYTLKSHNGYVDNSITEYQCHYGYNGRWYENDLCLNLNCQHNGTYQRLPYEQTKCICTEQWHGNEYQYDVDKYSINKTDRYLNNGTCVNYPDGYGCQCRENYFGFHCKQKHILFRIFTVLQRQTMSSR